MLLRWQCLDMNRTETQKIWLRLSGARIADIIAQNVVQMVVVGVAAAILGLMMNGTAQTEKGSEVGWPTGRT